ncbi:hypothetical protein HMPREF9123_1433 [Neisseria bacilliformis ATCC BAA-1200]|uniref:Uncharacterized protein n=1 Tax=Neisseria bacilliformis ATCC BAA-1200 TaxID=888742 RepID=F2BCH8_9NEIS|nr:hypothetical protein HMPREF9123_1433 [Neisseria bacilliformis ATCC BAA-1200]
MHFGSTFQIGCGGRLGLFSDGLKSLPRGFAPYGIAAEKNQGGFRDACFAASGLMLPYFQTACIKNKNPAYGKRDSDCGSNGGISLFYR